VLGDTVKKNKRTRITLPWDVSSYFSEQVPECEDDDEEEEEEMNAANMKRLKSADERTKNMTKEEYVHYSECRQASFTFRKAKRFRDWAGFGIVTDSKPNDDIVDILGFLTFEIVQTLTEEALKVKAEEDLTKSRNGDPAANSNKRKRETGLFDPPEEGRAPVGPKHIQEAYRRLQQRPIPGRGKRVWLGGPMALQRTELKLVCTWEDHNQITAGTDRFFRSEADWQHLQGAVIFKLPPDGFSMARWMEKEKTGGAGNGFASCH
jgi:transcription initiation protein SPT3